METLYSASNACVRSSSLDFELVDLLLLIAGAGGSTFQHLDTNDGWSWEGKVVEQSCRWHNREGTGPGEVLYPITSTIPQKMPSVIDIWD